ncbi:MAG TPA: hypothetical protein PKK43_01785, partial [Spirochaetota bacterium]|nr:hypothetical protein [Spirochaetota bacterium]
HRIFTWGMAEKTKYLTPLIEKYIHPRIDALKLFIQKGIDEGYFDTPNVNFAAISIISVVHSFVSFRDKFTGTELCDRIYAETSKDDFIRFFITSVFKILNPPDKALLIPEIPREVTEFIDDIIRQILDDENSEFSDEIFSRIIALIQT